MTVTNSVHLTLPPFQVGIDQDWVVGRHVSVFLQVLAEFFLVINNLHRLTTEYVTWPDQYWVTDLVGSVNYPLVGRSS